MVIHGYVYQDDQEDLKLINNFIKTMSVGVVKPKYISRIGKDINPGKKCPLLVKFNEQEEETKDFGNLSQLRGIDEYKKSK